MQLDSARLAESLDEGVGGREQKESRATSMFLAWVTAGYCTEKGMKDSVQG